MLPPMLSLVLAALAAEPARYADAAEDLAPLGGPDAAPIINGEEADADEYPQAGAMIMDMDLDMGSYGSGTVRTLVCSSTLIAPDVVMLAAHCLDEMAFTYGYGSMDINEIRWTRQADLSRWDGTQRNPGWPDDSIVASDWVAHEDFDLMDLGMGVTKNSDVALLFLEEPVLDTPFAYIPTEEETDQLVEGEIVTVVGWGQQEATDGYESPPEGTYAIKQMGDAPLGELGEHEFQVGPDRGDVRKCHGDSGGPTFIRIDTDAEDTLRVVGVTSHAYDSTDCERTGGVDTRVMAFRGWIDEQMRERCADGTRAWCEEQGLPVPPLPAPIAEGPKGEVEEHAACDATSAAPGLAPWLLGLAALVRRRRG